jgi:hypothetical protein
MALCCWFTQQSMPRQKVRNSEGTIHGCCRTVGIRYDSHLDIDDAHTGRVYIVNMYRQTHACLYAIIP